MNAQMKAKLVRVLRECKVADIDKEIRRQLKDDARREAMYAKVLADISKRIENERRLAVAERLNSNINKRRRKL
jgi:hypothetical protein